ncbi:hypothetical protein [Alkalicoccus daliensis]|uniref:Uncharacterized protein n=1 Tax=Alkalicoccus daliensis TaxID=745820 RepID=A0A1H0DXX7_9BACI|nr:hypothetical protein [Alkalicoccus daliensis]SDN74918.1 hypothetical protein SAMN04488053_103126 [Alkalicoccus daliensis]
MNIEKQDVLHLVDNLSEDDLRVVYTFIQEYRIAEMEVQHERNMSASSL